MQGNNVTWILIRNTKYLKVIFIFIYSIINKSNGKKGKYSRSNNEKMQILKKEKIGYKYFMQYNIEY